MRKIYVLFFCLFAASNLYAQEQELISTYIVTSIKNGDGTNSEFEKVEIQIYKEGYSEQLYMSHNWLDAGFEIQGPIYLDSMTEHYEASYFFEKMHYRWQFVNPENGQEYDVSTILVQGQNEDIVGFMLLVLLPGGESTIYEGYLLSSLPSDVSPIYTEEEQVSLFDEHSFELSFSHSSIESKRKNIAKDWTKSKSDFVFNYNENGDIALYTENGQQDIFRKKSSIVQLDMNSGEKYEAMEMRSDALDMDLLFELHHRPFRAVYVHFIDADMTLIFRSL